MTTEYLNPASGHQVYTSVNCNGVLEIVERLKKMENTEGKLIIAPMKGSGMSTTLKSLMQKLDK